MFMILENFRDFEKDEFALDVKCDRCFTITEQYLVIESKTFCKGCLEDGIQMLNKNFMQHCKDSWDKRKRGEENDKIRNSL